MNSEGLYIQANARETGLAFYNTGTNPGKTRVRIDMLSTLVARNSATVKEAVSFIKNGFKEKLLQYYAGNEEPLRDVGEIMTTGLQFSVNCNKKSVIVRFFEKEELTYEFDVEKILK